MGILWGQLRGCLPHHPVNSRTPKWNNSKQVGEFNYFSNAIFNNTTFMFLPKFPSNIEIMLFFDLLILFSHSFWFLFILIFAFVFTQSSFTLNGWNLFDISRGAISSWNKRLPLGLWTWHPAIWHECCLLSLILWVFSGKQLHSTGRSAQCFVTTERGGIGRMGGKRKREEIWGYMCTYSWFTLLYSRNKHNIVNPLYSHKN